MGKFHSDDPEVRETESEYDFQESFECEDLESRIAFCEGFLEKYSDYIKPVENIIKESDKYVYEGKTKTIYVPASSIFGYGFHYYRDINEQDKQNILNHYYMDEVRRYFEKLLDTQPDLIKLNRYSDREEEVYEMTIPYFEFKGILKNRYEDEQTPNFPLKKTFNMFEDVVI